MLIPISCLSLQLPVDDSANLSDKLRVLFKVLEDELFNPSNLTTGDALDNDLRGERPSPDF
jgi:hypothetical protein